MPGTIVQGILDIRFYNDTFLSLKNLPLSCNWANTTCGDVGKVGSCVHSISRELGRQLCSHNLGKLGRQLCSYNLREVGSAVVLTQSPAV